MNVDTGQFEALCERVDSQEARLARTEKMFDELFAIMGDVVGASAGRGAPVRQRRQRHLRLVKDCRP